MLKIPNAYFECDPKPKLFNLHCPDDERELRLEAGHVGHISQDNCQVSGALVVESEVLRVGLGNKQLEVAIIHEVAHRPSVGVLSSIKKFNF